MHVSAWLTEHLLRLLFGQMQTTLLPVCGKVATDSPLSRSVPWDSPNRTGGRPDLAFRHIALVPRRGQQAMYDVPSP